ncbi:hypothetical protein [Actinospongicola halichondriae]|uniref:hypothetical protein n=1 Tax=Actinospongicola halichondriae TaxID=3236844 RepID=UPI003D4A1CB1
MRRISSIFLAIAAVLAVASCGKAAEKIAEKGTEKLIEESAGGGDVDINDDGSFSFENDEGSFSIDEDGNVKIEGEDGEFSIEGNSDGELPDDFPDVPLPDGFTPQSNSKQSDGEATIYSAVGTADGDAADVFESLIDDYESDGYDTDGRYENTSGDDFTGGAQFVGSDHQVSVSVFGSDGETTVSITVLPAEE